MPSKPVGGEEGLPMEKIILLAQCMVAFLLAIAFLIVLIKGL